MTFKLLKRRYRSSDTREKYRRLDYFNHPFEENNDIKLIDDINLAKSLSVESVGSQFSTIKDKEANINVVERIDISDNKKGKTKSKKPHEFIQCSPGEFEPFNENLVIN